jgi:hypothetical protein
MVTAEQSGLMKNALTLANKSIYFFVIYDIKDIMSGNLIPQDPQEVIKPAEMKGMINIPILFSKRTKTATQTSLVESDFLLF